MTNQGVAGTRAVLLKGDTVPDAEKRGALSVSWKLRGWSLGHSGQRSEQRSALPVFGAWREDSPSPTSLLCSLWATV